MELFCSDFGQMQKTKPSGTGPKVDCSKSERVLNQGHLLWTKGSEHSSNENDNVSYPA